MSQTTEKPKRMSKEAAEALIADVRAAFVDDSTDAEWKRGLEAGKKLVVDLETNRDPPRIHEP